MAGPGRAVATWRVGAYQVRLAPAVFRLTRPFRIAYEETRSTDGLYVAVSASRDFDEPVGWGEATPVEVITGEHPAHARASVAAVVRRWSDRATARDRGLDQDLALGSARSDGQPGEPSMRADPGLAIDRSIFEMTPEEWTLDHIAREVDTILPAGGRVVDRSARNALVGALADLAARSVGAPLSRWFAIQRGTASSDEVVSSITVPLLPDEELVPVVRSLAAAGHRALKIKAGQDLAADLARAREIRELVGSAIELRIDVNQGWTIEETRKAIPVLEEVGVTILEQPLDRIDLAGHAELREETSIDVMLDESVMGPLDLEAAIEAEAADLINVKLAKCGGPDVALDMIDRAEAAGIGCMVGCMVGSAIDTLHGLHVAAAHPHAALADLDGCTFLAGDPVRGGPRMHHGRYHVPDEPGIAASTRGDMPRQAI